MLSFDVICVGNAKIDAFLSIHHAGSHIRLNKDTKELCVKFGEKIPVDKCSFFLGGNACNTAVGLSKLEINTALMAEMGKDEFSQKIINGLIKENVNIDLVQQTENEQSSFSMIITFQEERTIFSEHAVRRHNFSFENVSTKYIYLTSLGNTWENAYEETRKFISNKKAKLAFNPGTLQLLAGYQKIKGILETTDILFVNKEEAITILGNKNLASRRSGQISNRELLNSLQQLGPKIAVITDGENGSFAVNEKGEFFTQAIVKTEIVEKTGAGDAYASGFLAAILSNLPIQKAMKWGTLNSSATMAVLGAQNGLLSKTEIEQKNG